MFLEKVFHIVLCFLLLLAIVDQFHRLGKRELICLLLFTCNYVVYVWKGFLFLWVLGMGYVILLWHSLRIPYNYFVFLNVPYFFNLDPGNFLATLKRILPFR